VNSCTSSSEAAARRWAAWTAALAASFGLLVAGASEWLVRLRVVPNDVHALHLAFFAGARSADAAFGDSRVAYGFSPGEAMVNLADSGDAVETTAFKIRTYYASRDPGRVVLQADPEQFSPRGGAAEQIAQYLDAPLLHSLTPQHRASILTYWRMLLTGAPFRSVLEFNSDGSRFGNDRFDWKLEAAQLADAGRKAMLRRPDRRNWSEPLAAWTDYVSAVDFLLARGARLCLVAFPVSPEFRRFTDGVPEYEAARAAIARLASERGVRFADFRAATDDGRLFYDEDHLNADGARAISPRIVEACFGSNADAAG